MKHKIVVNAFYIPMLFIAPVPLLQIFIPLSILYTALTLSAFSIAYLFYAKRRPQPPLFVDVRDVLSPPDTAHKKSYQKLRQGWIVCIILPWFCILFNSSLIGGGISQEMELYEIVFLLALCSFNVAALWGSALRLLAALIFKAEDSI